MSRLTKQIRLVLISSSLILPGCQQKPAGEPDCNRRQPGAAVPPACGPVDGRSAWTGGAYHGWGYHAWYSGGYGGGRSGTFGGKAATLGSVRGGFGASAHGAGS